MHTDVSLPGILIQEQNSEGLITLAVASTPPDDSATLANKFAIGCLIEDSSTGSTYQNVGTLASPSWNAVSGGGDIPDGSVTLAKLAEGIYPLGIIKYGEVVQSTGGSTTETVVMPGVTAFTIPIAQMLSLGATPVSILSVSPAANEVHVTFSGDPSNDHRYAVLVMTLAE